MEVSLPTTEDNHHTYESGKATVNPMLLGWRWRHLRERMVLTYIIGDKEMYIYMGDVYTYMY